jgi:glyoxylase-like metal-dependent hydrolase (beta-lactamase superfamily II)
MKSGIKFFLRFFGIITVLAVMVAAVVYVKYLRPFFAEMKQTDQIQLHKNLRIVTGGGGNSGIYTSHNLVVLIDTKMDEAAMELHAQVEEMAKGKNVVIINTHNHPDHIGGNALYKKAHIIAGNYGKEKWLAEAKAETLPQEWLKDTMRIALDDDTLLVFNLQKNIHTTNDVMVYALRRKILFAGDVILNHQAPVLMGQADGDGYLAFFNVLMDKFPIRAIIPGHGSIGGMEILDDFKMYFIDMKKAAQNSEMEDEIVNKYKNWKQLPWFMSPSATIAHFRKKGLQ